MTRRYAGRRQVALAAVVLAGALAATATARAAGSPAPGPGPTAAPQSHVALGDSYSAGSGTSAPGDRCGRTAKAYPALFAAANPGMSFRSVACGGATTSDIRIQQVPGLTDGTDLVTVTAGGNDAGFSAVGRDCVLGTTAACRAAVDRGNAVIRDLLPGRLDALFSEIRAAAPNARVIVLGYPRLFEVASCEAVLGQRFNAENLTLVNGAADDLAEAVAASAARSGVRFVDVRTAFAGHAACASGAWINLLGAGALHPNDRGHVGYLRELTSAVG